MTSFAPRHRLALAVVLCSAVIVSTACASTGRAIGGDPFQGGSSSPRRSNDSAGELRIQVRNSNFNEATIYAIRLGSRRRLGRVQGASDGEFRMRLVNSDQIQFEADLLASKQPEPPEGEAHRADREATVSTVFARCSAAAEA